jgi:hypothetical protein
MMRAVGNPSLGIAHFTVGEAPPVGLAARTGYACSGLRLHPAFPGAPCYEIPTGSAAMREMRRRLEDENVAVYDIELVTLAEGFEPAGLAAMIESADASLTLLADCRRLES